MITKEMPLSLHNWDSFLYQFIVGGFLFSLGIILPIASGDVRWSRLEDRYTVVAIVLAMLSILTLFTAWQFYAIERG